MMIDPLFLSRIEFAYTASFHIGFPVTLDAGAAPVQALEFLFSGAGIVVFPLVLIYTVVVTWALRGKV